MRSVTVAAPAKINLALHVTGRRADGFHDIETLVAFAAHGDRIVIETAPVEQFTLSGPFAQALANENFNLVPRAAAAMRKAVQDGGFADPEQVHIHLEKHLPVASGLGGGSADAAATLLGLQALWGLPDAFAITAIASELGADVPMCLRSRPLIATGAGENITQVAMHRPLHAVLVNPGIAVSTGDVFGALARRENPPFEPFPSGGVEIGWLRRQRNDLQGPATGLCPAIGDVLEAIERSSKPLLARMSGSGASCFGLYPSAAEAREAAARIGEGHSDWWRIATQLAPGDHPHRLVLTEKPDEQD